MRKYSVVALLLLTPLLMGAARNEFRLNGGISDTTKTSTGMAPTFSGAYRLELGHLRLSPSLTWSAVRKESVSGGSGNWTGALSASYTLGQGNLRPMFGLGGSYTYTDSATWTKKVAYGSAHVGLRIYPKENRFKDGNGRWYDYSDITLTGSKELYSTYANDTYGVSLTWSINEHIGGGWFFVTDISFGGMWFHPNPYDNSWMNSGTMRLSLGVMKSR